MVLFELSFDTEYTVDLSTLTIDPDPSDDNYFIPLICLYSAVKIANSEYKSASLSGISITDGPTSIDMGGQVTSMLQRMKALQADWQNAKLQYMMGNAIGCQGVLSTLRSVYGSCYYNGYFDEQLYNQLTY
jgi:hypothetical protein